MHNMAAKKIVKVWDNGEILNENIEFLQKKNKKCFLPTN